jgi:deferrochelatase/peroxidase EfeB
MVRQRGSSSTFERSCRIVRRGISYGSTDLNPEQEWSDAGLLFISLQSNIEQQFILMQNAWCNSEGFVKNGTGIDPLIGQTDSDRPSVTQEWPRQWGKQSERIKFDFSDVVRTKGGEYFFVPSISFLRQMS